MADIWIILFSISLQGITLIFILYHLKNQDKLSISEWRTVVQNTREDLEPLIQQDLKNGIVRALEPVMASISKFDQLFASMGELVDQLEEYDVFITSINTHVSTIEGKIQSISTTVTANDQEINQLLNQISMIKASMNNLLQRFDDQQGVINRLNQKVDALDASITEYAIDTPYGVSRT